MLVLPLSADFSSLMVVFWPRYMGEACAVLCGTGRAPFLSALPTRSFLVISKDSEAAMVCAWPEFQGFSLLAE